MRSRNKEEGRNGREGRLDEEKRTEGVSKEKEEEGDGRGERG